MRAVDDGLFGFSDASGQFIARLGLWNHKDEIVKERLFGLSGTQVMIKLYDSAIKSFSSCILGLISMFKFKNLFICPKSVPGTLDCTILYSCLT